MTTKEAIDNLKMWIKVAGNGDLEQFQIIDKDIESMKILLDELKKQKKQIKELKQDNKEYQMILDIGDQREYRKRYLKERRKEEPNLLYPDADEIYKRYYEEKEKNKELLKEYNKKLNANWEDAISKDKIRKKIEEYENAEGIRDWDKINAWKELLEEE